MILSENRYPLFGIMLWRPVSRTFALTLLRRLRRRPDHGFELHAVGIGEIDRVIAVAVILARRIDHSHAVLFEKSAEIVHRFAAGQLECVVMETNIALAIFVLAPLRIGGGDPEQRLAVAPAGHVAVFVLQFEAEKFQELVVKRLRAREIADAENEMIDADDARHGSVQPLWFCGS